MSKRARYTLSALALIAALTIMAVASLDGCNELRAVRIGPDGPQSHRCTL